MCYWELLKVMRDRVTIQVVRGKDGKQMAWETGIIATTSMGFLYLQQRNM